MDPSLLYNLNLPLSERLRPNCLEEYIGQNHLINSSNGEISNFLRLGYLPSMILWGPPGVGKTSIAKLLADHVNYVFVELSATDSTVADLRNLSGEIRAENNAPRRRGERLRVVVFIDEIHRFTSVQQDFLLPFIESGDFVFLGATTVEPHKRIRGAILSRCQLFRLEKLEEEDVLRVVRKAILYQNIQRKKLLRLKFLHYSDQSMADIAKYSNGDMRVAINAIELMSSRFMGQEHTTKTSDTSTLDMVDVTAQDIKQLIENLDRSRFGLTRSSSLPYFSSLFATLRSGGEQQNPLALRKSASPSSSPVRGPIAEDSEHPEWDSQMIFSDDSDVEPGNLYSDEEDTGDDPSEVLVSAIECILLMLKNGESPHFIIKTLIVYTCRWHPVQDTLVKLVSAFKSIEKSDSDKMQTIIACIEILLRRTKTEQLDLPLKDFKNFLGEVNSLHQNDTPQAPVLDVCYDDDLVRQLLSTVDKALDSPPVSLNAVSLLDLPTSFTTGGDISIWTELPS